MIRNTEYIRIPKNMFWIYWVGVNTKLTIRQLVVTFKFTIWQLEKYKIYNMTNRIRRISGPKICLNRGVELEIFVSFY